METGEILPDTVAAKRPDYCKPIHTSERQLQREYVLSRLRPEVRAFAQFVLKFRNRRRGITPECDTLCKWYAKLTGKRASDVRRYLRALEGARILDGRALVGSLWQLAGHSLSPGEHTQEDKRAEALFQVMLMDSQAIPEHSEPPNWWPEGRTTEDTEAHLVTLAAVPRTPAMAAST